VQRNRNRDRRYSESLGDLGVGQPFEKSQGKDFGGALREFGQSLAQKLPEIAVVGPGAAGGGEPF
jgi:hypothetical protein